jgi:hypothetical protein
MREMSNASILPVATIACPHSMLTGQLTSQVSHPKETIAIDIRDLDTACRARLRLEPADCRAVVVEVVADLGCEVRYG